MFVAAKKTGDGRYYIDVLDAASTFAPNQTINISLQFNQYPGANYTVQVLAGSGAR